MAPGRGGVWCWEMVSVSMWEFVVLRSRGCHSEAPHTGCFKPQILIPSKIDQVHTGGGKRFRNAFTSWPLAERRCRGRCRQAKCSSAPIAPLTGPAEAQVL